jgi:hypothetical protein
MMDGLPPLPEGATLDSAPSAAPASSPALPSLPEGATLDAAPAAQQPGPEAFKSAPSKGGTQAVEPARLDRFLNGVFQGYAGAEQLMARALPYSPVGAVANVVAPGTGDRWAKQWTGAADERAKMLKEEASSLAKGAGVAPDSTDWMNVAGQVASPVNYVGGAGAGAAAKALPFIGKGIAKSAIATGLAEGAGMAAMQPVVTQPGEDFATEKAKQIGIGAGTGAIAAPLISAAGAVIKPAINPAAKKLMAEDVTPTLGQIVDGTGVLGTNIRRAEDVAAKFPIFGAWVRGAQERGMETFNVAAANRALAPIGAKVPEGMPVGHELFNHVEKRLNAAYNKVHPLISAQIDNALTQDLGTIAQNARMLPASQKGQLQEIIATQITEKFAAAGGRADGKTLQGMTSELGRLGSGWAGDPSVDTRMLGQAVNDVRDALSAALERQNPAQAPLLKRANEGWAVLTRLRAAGSSTATQAYEGAFTPTQLGMAARRMDKTTGNGASARGDALMQDLAEAGKKVLPSKLADSGTPERLGTGLILGHGVGSGMIGIPGILTAAALPLLYSKPGQALARAALTKRPAGSQAVRDILKKYAPSAAARLPLLNQDTQ